MLHSSTRLIVLLCSVCLPAYADDATFDGWLRVDLFSSTRTLDDRSGAGSAELGLKYIREINDANKLRVEAKGYQELRDSENHLRFTDTYWQYHNSTIDLLRIGWQRISWGKADGLNPTDFFTPYDYTILQPFEEDQRQAVPAVRTDFFINEQHTLSLIAEPYFVAGKLPAPKDIHVDDRKPANGARRPQVGARWSSTGDRLDWSLSMFRGYLTTPLFGANSSGLYNHYSKLDGYGADIARNFGRWGARAEIAWLQPNNRGVDGIQPHIYSVVGVDRGDDDWNINVQLVTRYVPNFHQPQDNSANPLLNMAVRQNAVNFGQFHSTLYGATGRLSNWWFNQTLHGELLLIGYFNPGNLMTRATMTYSISDTDKFSLGGEHYTGPEQSFFGQLKANRTVFITYQHFF